MPTKHYKECGLWITLTKNYKECRLLLLKITRNQGWEFALCSFALCSFALVALRLKSDGRECRL